MRTGVGLYVVTFRLSLALYMHTYHGACKLLPIGREVPICTSWLDFDVLLYMLIHFNLLKTRAAVETCVGNNVMMNLAGSDVLTVEPTCGMPASCDIARITLHCASARA